MGIKAVERDALPGGLDDAHMLASKFAGMTQTAGVGDHFDLLVHVSTVGRYPGRLVLDDKATLQAWLVGGDASRTGIGMAAQGLDTTQREHEAACRIHEVSARCKRPRDAGWSHQLAGSDDPNPSRQTAGKQRVGDQRQCLVD